MCVRGTAQAVESFVYRHDMDAKIDLSKRSWLRNIELKYVEVKLV